LTDEQLAELRALDALADKDIDTSDIPEIGMINGGWREKVIRTNWSGR
jgi:hypothetical protein